VFLSFRIYSACSLDEACGRKTHERYACFRLAERINQPYQSLEILGNETLKIRDQICFFVLSIGKINTNPAKHLVDLAGAQKR
jgi:hypothetical protein